MKKISTLVLASLLTMAVFAADRRPTVTLQSTRNYEIVIDGKSYTSNNFSTMNIGGLRDGYHSVTVYKVQQGFFFRKMKKVVSSTSFLLRGNDIDIKVNQFGQVKVDEDLKFQKGRGWDKNDNDNRGRDNQGRDNRGQDNQGGGKRF